MNKRFRLCSSLTVNLNDLAVVNSYDNIAEAIVAADGLARDARFDGYPLKLIVVTDAWAGRIEYRTRA